MLAAKGGGGGKAKRKKVTANRTLHVRRRLRIGRSVSSSSLCKVQPVDLRGTQIENINYQKIKETNIQLCFAGAERVITLAIDGYRRYIRYTTILQRIINPPTHTLGSLGKLYTGISHLFASLHPMRRTRHQSDIRCWYEHLIVHSYIGSVKRSRVNWPLCHIDWRIQMYSAFDYSLAAAAVPINSMKKKSN